MSNRGKITLTQTTPAARVLPTRAAARVSKKNKASDAPLKGALDDSTLEKLARLRESLKTTTGKR